jgi:hypothetical protein
MMTKRAVVAWLLLAAACGRPAQPVTTPSSPTVSVTASPSRAAGTARPAAPVAGRKIAVVVMENKEYRAVAGNPDAPFVNGLARKYATATSYYAVSHPSLPNYLALIGGDTFGITSDCTSCRVGAPTLADQLQDKHVTWRAYMEGMPHACFTGASSGRYAKKHNPFVYFDGVVSDTATCGNVVPLRTIDYNALPDFVWITPDLCNDTHDCPVAAGDRYLQSLVPKLLSALGPRGAVVITYDEGSSSTNGGGHVFTVLAGPGVRPGRYTQTFTHYSLLRTIEDAFGLGTLGRARSAPSMQAMLR